MSLLIIKKTKKNTDNITYYILFTCSDNNDIKINSILTALSNQIENYPFNSENKNIKIIVCKDTIELYIKNTYY